MKGEVIIKKVTMRELVGKDIRITDFRIKNDKAIVELEVDGEYCYFETTNLEVLRQLSWIKQCEMIYKFNKNTKNICWVRKCKDSIHYNESGDPYIETEEFSNTENVNDRYLCFYKNSVYVKIIKQKSSICFSPNISKETIDKLIKNDNAVYTKKTEKIIKEEKSDTKTN